MEFYRATWAIYKMYIVSEKNQYAEQCIDYVSICFKNTDIDTIYAFYICVEFIGFFNWKI